MKGLKKEGRLMKNGKKTIILFNKIHNRQSQIHNRDVGKFFSYIEMENIFTLNIQIN